MISEKMIEIAVQTIKVSKEEIANHCKELPEINATYFWDTQRGGLAVIVAEDGAKLGATSSVRFEKHQEVFKSGRRN